MSESEKHFFMSHCKPEIINNLTRKADRNAARISLIECQDCSEDHALWQVTEYVEGKVVSKSYYDDFLMLTEHIQKMPL